jgi:membrane-associated protease RseP (regulator of RpoE activity)
LTPKVSGVPECVAASASPNTTYRIESSSAGSCPNDYVPGPAYAAGLKEGDRIVSINNTPIETWDDLLSTVGSANNSFFTVQIQPAGSQDYKNITVEATKLPRMVRDENLNFTGEIQSTYILGVVPSYENIRGTPLDVPAYTLQTTQKAVQALIRFPQKLHNLTVNTIIQGQERDIESPVSVVGVSRIGGEIAAAEQPVESKIIIFLGLIASVNLFLFLFNLLPILPLDGGHMAVASYEGTKNVVQVATKK